MTIVLWFDNIYFSQDVHLVGTAREHFHFRRRTHYILPPAKSIAHADLTPCSWAYIEVNAGEGRDLAGFFTDANRVFEESLRAELAPSRAFCAAAFEPNTKHAQKLFAVRADKARFTRRFHVFPGVVVPSGREDEDYSRKRGLSSVSLPEIVKKLTYEQGKVGLRERKSMATALANGHRGIVFVRIAGAVEELFSYLQLLDDSGVLCDRIDRLALHVTKFRVNGPDDPQHVHPAIEPQLQIPMSELVRYALTIERREACRARVFVMDDERQLLSPKVLDSSGILYAVLAGAPTFNDRISAQTDSWMQGVPRNRIAIYTNVPREPQDLTAARGHNVFVVQPTKPELEKRLTWMQSWSHLVRLKESWDRFMRNDSSIKWLALVDDDTFVFPAGMREYLTMFDSRKLLWGGSGEQVRIDNGDHGEFAYWLRNLTTAHGSSKCYLPEEDIPESVKLLQAQRSLRKGKKRRKFPPSAMCRDTFCPRGCPAVPQGAAIVVSRALVEKLRPVVEQCEEATASLCERCGSQRLYMCVNRFVENAKTIFTRGICRSPWKIEHRDMYPYALTFHAFDKLGRGSLSTDSIHGDMQQLWKIGSQYEVREPWHGTVPMQEVANLVQCGGTKQYVKGLRKCVPFHSSRS